MKALPIQVQEQIEHSVVRTKLDLERLAERVQLGFTNSARAIERANEQETAMIDLRQIQESIQNTIDDNMLENAGFELDEEIPSQPDEWVIINEIGRPNGDCFLDDARAKYGYRSLKMEGINPLTVPKNIYVRQEVQGPFIGNGFYTISYYYFDTGNENFSYYANVDIYDKQGTLLHREESVPDAKAAEYIGYTLDMKNFFVRHHTTFEMPTGAYKAIVSLGIQVAPGTTNLVEAWFDYPIFHPGIHSPRPAELIDGIMRTRHISTEGLDAKVIKTGVIEITERLSLATKGGDIRLRFDDASQGNVLEFISGDQSIITMGKFGSGAQDYGLVIQNADGRDSMRVDRLGNLSLGVGDIGAQIVLDGSNSLIKIQDKSGTEQVRLGQYATDQYGIKAGGTVLNASGIDIASGRIRLGNDGHGNPLFSVTDQGYLKAESGTIAGFTIHNDILQSNSASLILNGTTSSITLSELPNYKTHLQPGGIFGTVPLARVSTSNFDPTRGGSKYYLEIKRIYSGATEYIEGVDFLYNKVSGEIIRRKGSTMPDMVSVQYVVYDYNENTDVLTETVFTETLTFQVTTRASAIITDDSLLDASFVKNLIAGTADIGIASINTAHIRELHGNRILAHTIDANHLIIGKGGNLVPNSTFTSDEFYKDWPDLMLGSPNVTDNVVTNGYEHLDNFGLYDGKCVKLTTSSGDKYFGLDVQIGVTLKPNTYYVFSAFHKLTLGTGASLTGFYLDVSGNSSDVSSTDLPGSDNNQDKVTHEWKRKAVRFKTGTSGYVRLRSMLKGVSGGIVDAWVDGFMLEEGYNESDFYKGGITRIHGSQIETKSITLNELAFTPVDETSIIAIINASEEGLRIASDKIRIDGSVAFSSGYDPSTKETPAGAQAKANAAKEYAEMKATEARQSAEAVAIAEAELARITAEAHADSIVTAEEQARINQAATNLAAAKADATAKANAAEAAAKDASLSKSVYLTPGKTTIDGGQITTHSIATEAIKIGSTINMINNFSESNHLKGWSNYGSSTLVQEIQKDGRVVRTLKTVTDGNMQIQSDYIEIDPTATYEIRLSIYSAHADATGTRYFGMHAYDENFTNIGVIPFSVSNRTFGTATTNLYFWSGGVYGGSWRDMTAYILGCNVEKNEVPVGRNVSTHAKFHPDARYIRIRFLNYYNNGVSVRNDFYSPSITRVGTTTIAGDQITTGTLDAKKVNVIDLNAANITTGKLNANNVTVEAQGASGRVDITSLGIWAKNSSGVAQAGFDVTGRFSAGGGSVTADATGLRVQGSKGYIIFNQSGQKFYRTGDNNPVINLDTASGSGVFRGLVIGAVYGE